MQEKISNILLILVDGKHLGLMSKEVIRQKVTISTFIFRYLHLCLTHDFGDSILPVSKTIGTDQLKIDSCPT